MNRSAIMFVSPFPPALGGIPQNSSQIVQAMRNRVEVRAIGWRHHYPPVLYKGNRTSIPHSHEETTFSLTWYNPFSWIAVGLRARRARLVVFAWVSPFDAFPYWLIATIARRPITAIVHNVEQHESLPFARFLTALFVGQLDRAVVHSENVKSDLIGLRPHLDVTVVPHPPNIDVSDVQQPPAGRFRFLQPGFVRAYKGADIAIKGLAIARDSGLDAELHILGQFWGVDPEDLHRVAEDTGISDFVRISDRYVSDADLVQAIQDANAILLPYRSATQSGLVPIALAAGRPVIVTDVGGLAEQVSAGINAIVASAATPVHIAQALNDLSDSYSRLREGCLEYGTSWDDVVNALLSEA